MSLGLSLILAAFLLTGYNLLDERRAEKEAADIITALEEQAEITEETALEEPEYTIYPEMEMPTVKIDGKYYVGTLEIPSLHLKLPVMEDWSYEQLKLAPCRYKGSVYREDMIIAAHNYRGHFGELEYLDCGDEIIFTDVDGNAFTYVVAATEILKKTDVEKMEAGEWDLTLFTCTYDGRTRFTVRCKKIGEGSYDK